MKKMFPASLSIAAAILMTACGGGSDESTGSLQPQAAAAGNFSMTIPLDNLGDNPTRVPASVASGDATSLKPMFIDGDSNGKVALYFDGVNVLTITPSKPTLTPTTTVALADGGYFKYSLTPGVVGNSQRVLTINGSYLTVPGPHTFGAVQTNGPCETVGPLCLPASDGYVLAQGEVKMNMSNGANPDAKLYMRGVMQSVYICDAACDGHQGAVDGDGFYHVYVVVADENGTAITHQESNGSVIPFDNGSYQIREDKGANPDALLSIKTEAGGDIVGKSMFAPGIDRANGGYGVSIKFKCVHPGKTKLVAQLDANGGASVAPIGGFTAQSGVNYPVANMVLGSVGAAQNFGNQLDVDCDASGKLTIM